MVNRLKTTYFSVIRDVLISRDAMKLIRKSAAPVQRKDEPGKVELRKDGDPLGTIREQRNVLSRWEQDRPNEGPADEPK